MLTQEDKGWLRDMVRREFRRIIEEMVAAEEGQSEPSQLGGYDGATKVTEDDWAEEGRVGFKVPRGILHDRKSISRKTHDI